MKQKLWQAPFIGFSFFIKRPEIWPGILGATFCCFFAYFGFFLIVLLAKWPQNFPEAASSFQIYKAFSVAIGSSLIGWFALISVIYNLVILGLFEKVAKIRNEPWMHLSFYNKLKVCLNLLYSNGQWRVLWIVASALIAVFLGPSSIVISQIGLAHLALLDGAALISRVDRNVSFSINNPRNFLAILIGGFLGGFVTFFCIPTIIVWLFWLPSLYVGIYVFIKDGECNAP